MKEKTFWFPWNANIFARNLWDKGVRLITISRRPYSVRWTVVWKEE